MATDDQEIHDSSHKSVVSNQANLSWQADSFVRYSKGADWHIGVILIGVLAVTMSILFRDQMLVSIWLTVPVILVAVAVTVWRGIAKPKDVQYNLTEDGLHIDDSVIAYQSFRAFSMLEYDNHTMLRLWPTNRLHFPISIVISPIDPEAVRTRLSDVMPEEAADQNLTDQISHFLKL